MSNTHINHPSSQIKSNFDAQSEAAFLAEISHFIQEEEKGLQELRDALRELSSFVYGI